MTSSIFLMSLLRNHQLVLFLLLPGHSLQILAFTQNCLVSFRCTGGTTTLTLHSYAHTTLPVLANWCTWSSRMLSQKSQRLPSNFLDRCTEQYWNERDGAKPQRASSSGPFVEATDPWFLAAARITSQS